MVKTNSFIIVFKYTINDIIFRAANILFIVQNLFSGNYKVHILKFCISYNEMWVDLFYICMIKIIKSRLVKGGRILPFGQNL